MEEFNESYISCRTCLGSLDSPRDLCETKYKHLLELLQGILGFEIKDQVFKICKKCDIKLKFVLKFKDECLRSLENFVNIECKEEPLDTDPNDTLVSEDFHFTVESKNSRYKNESFKKASKKSQTFSEALENVKLKADKIIWNDSNSNDSFDNFNPIEKFETDNGDEGFSTSKRGVRLDQFPKRAVLEAMAECRSFFTKAKNKTCLHCNYIGKTARGLSVHMSFMHSILAKTWCYHCNVQTKDLPSHKKLTNCSEFYCKFCGKYACSVKRATEHLRFHCSKESLDDVLPKRGLWHKQYNRRDVLQAIAEHKSHFTDPLSVTCLHCDYMGVTGRGLSIHMSTLHRDEAKNWCYRCNMQTMDLEEHKNSTKCYIYFCKFCDKYACLIKHTITHLESHCRGLSTFEENDDLEESEEVEDPFEKENNLEDSISAQRTETQNAALSKDCDECFKEVQPEFVNPSQQTENLSFIDQDILISTDTVTDEIPLLSLPLREYSDLNKYAHEVIEKALQQIMKPFYTTRQCPCCEVISLNLRHLQKHVRLKHRHLKNTWCSRCNTLEENLPEHSKLHEFGLFQCVFCDKSYDTAIDIKDHIVFHSDTSNSELKAVWFNCKYCPNSFPNEDDLKNHKCPSAPSLSEKISHKGKLITKRLKGMITGLKPKPIKLKKRKTSTSLEGRKEAVYAKKFTKCITKKPRLTQLCSICGKVIGRVDFKNHMKIHGGAMFKCSHCDKQFTHKIYLIEHERRHTGEKSFLCGVCGKAFVTSSECKRHERIHEGGPQQCPVCDVQCNRPERLKLHMKRHTGENKFACAHCGISFHIKSLLLKHIKAHSDERPHKCSFCDQFFKHREEVTVHERTHTGIRPYSCTLCLFTSARSKELTNHMKKHPEDAPQANTPFNCQSCTKKFSTNAMLVSHTRNKHEYQTN